MRLSRFGGGVAAFCIGTAGLSGCSGFSSQVIPVRAGSPQSLWQPAARPPAQGQSWVAPEAKNEDLLYVSAENGVFVYSYTQGKKVGQLLAPHPGGDCSDAKGNIFVADINDSKILEFSHGARTPIATLPDPGYNPASCAIDPKTGDLAVTNFQSTTGGAGNLVIYPNAQGGRKLYVKNSSLQTPYFCAFDKAGDLFIDGFDSGSNTGFEELPKGSDSFEAVELNRHIGAPGGVQAVGQEIAVGDSAQGTVFTFAIRGNNGTVTSTTTLKGAQGGLAGFVILGKKIVAATGFQNTAGYWPYPSGGNPTKILKDLSVATGVAISSAK